MATTSVGTSRKPYQALEKYPDAVFITDDKKLFFGNGGDVSFEYDEDGNDVLATAGANIRISDTQELQIGDGGDLTLSHDATNTNLAIKTGALIATSGDIRLSDTVQIQIGDAGTDFVLAHDGTNTTMSIATGALVVSAGDIRLSDTVQLQFGDTSDIRVYYNATSDVLMLRGFPTTLSDVNPNVSDALYLVSDTKGTTSWVLAVSAGA